MSDFLKDILPISVVLTFVGTLFTLYYTRRNLKNTQYVQTITTERIKWIENLRLDLSTLASWITIYIHNQKNICELDVKYESLMENGYYDHDGEMFLPNPIDNDEIREIGTKTESYSKELESISKVKIIDKIHLIKLRLNINEDTEIMQMLDNLLTNVVLSDFQISEFQKSKNVLDQFISSSQIILKAEWDKVKKETRKGK